MDPRLLAELRRYSAGSDASAGAHRAEHAVSFASGFEHPWTGPDHMLAMVAVGLWAGPHRRPRAVGLAGGVRRRDGGGRALGIAGVPLPMVEPGILASVIVLGLLVLMAARLPVALGAALVALFAVLHGHAMAPSFRRKRRGRPLPGLRAGDGAAARASASALPTWPAATAAGSSCAAPARWWRPPASRSRSSEEAPMIPGEIITAPGEIELNAGPHRHHAHRRQHRRPADPGRLALPLRRDQPGAAVRPRQGARPPARHRRRHRRALRARPDARRAPGAVRRQARGLGFRQEVMGKL